jgi:hypothetical protein
MTGRVGAFAVDGDLEKTTNPIGQYNLTSTPNPQLHSKRSTFTRLSVEGAGEAEGAGAGDGDAVGRAALVLEARRDAARGKPEDVVADRYMDDITCV